MMTEGQGTAAVDYDLRLRIDYKYSGPAVGGRHQVCLIPLPDMEGQRVSHARLTITPPPQERLDRVDFFGNQVTEFRIHAPHDHLTLAMSAHVKRFAPPDSVSLADLPIAHMPEALSLVRDLGPASPLHCLAPSRRVQPNRAITAFARDVLAGGQGDTFATTLAIGQALHDHMTFDAAATHVDTPAEEAFAKARGVCQDFSHILITALRGLGIPAGYVSGFLRTLPPPGKPRLEGADAMHAWVRIWCGPQRGWVDYDPTNACLAGKDHIVAARGRDYSDVAPVKGSMRIAGGQKSRQAVDVIPVAPLGD